MDSELAWSIFVCIENRWAKYVKGTKTSNYSSGWHDISAVLVLSKQYIFFFVSPISDRLPQCFLQWESLESMRVVHDSVAPSLPHFAAFIIKCAALWKGVSSVLRTHRRKLVPAGWRWATGTIQYSTLENDLCCSLHVQLNWPRGYFWT